MKYLFCSICAVCFTGIVVGVSNNVCPTIEDYYTIADNSKCWYDFAADGNVTEIITKNGYPVEIHKATTPDGYILTVIRIPKYGANKGPVFLQHGLQSSAANFVARGKDSLAFLLSDEGYDVWMGNYRGNEYSEEHVNLTTNDRRYWDYSMDEIGLYDMPTQIKLVADNTGRKGNIVYIGHSLGTTVALVYGALYPEQAKQNVKLFIMLAPAASLVNMISPLKLLAPFSNTIYSVVEDNDLIRIASQGSVMRKMTRPICFESPLLMKRCMEIVNLFYGPKSQIGAEMIPVYLNQFPGGTSFKVVKHAAAMALNFFGRYDYGIKNMQKYGSAVPPKHKISKIKVPIFIMYSLGDWACTKRDSLVLYGQLSPEAKVHGIHEVSDTSFNHIDFLYGRNVKPMAYNHILRLLNKI